MRVSIPDVLHGIGRLLEIYARPRHLPEEAEAIAKIWHRELGDMDVEVFRAGVSAYCRTNAEFFPKPGQIRKLGELVARPSVAIEGLLGAFRIWEQSWAEAPLNHPIPCPVCGATDGWSQDPPTLRRTVSHDPVKHAALDDPGSRRRSQ